MKFGLRHIRYFIAVAEELHFRRAAENLGIAQPALSRAIQYLESELEVELFIRSNRNVQITPAGQIFHDGCRTVINLIKHTTDNTRLANEGRLGVLRIGYTDMAMAGCLPNVLKAFREQEPSIILQPHHDTTVPQLQKLESGMLDIGFVTGPISNASYEQYTVQSEKFVGVVYENHPLANRRSIKLENLAKEDFIHGSSKDWEQFYSYFLPLCHRSGFVPRIVQEAFNTAGILGLVSAEMGVTVLTDSVLNSIGPGLKAINIKDAAVQLQTVACWKSGSIDGAVQLFVEFLKQQRFQREQPYRT